MSENNLEERIAALEKRTKQLQDQLSIAVVSGDMDKIFNEKTKRTFIR